MNILTILFWCAVVGLGTLRIEAAYFQFYKGSFSNYIEIALDKPLELLPYLDKTKPTKVFVPGLNNSPTGRAVVRVVSTLITIGNANVLELNWSKESQGILPNIFGYPVAAAAAKSVARTCGQSLVTLIQNGIPADSIHFFGHSLGAHLSGWVGDETQKQNYKIATIYGMEPSGVGFDGNNRGLNPSCATYVYGLHTNAGVYGINKSVGIVDFWANCGSSRQPGCPSGIYLPLSEESLCSHDRSWMLVCEALLNPGTVIASAAGSCNAWTSASTVTNDVGNVDPSKQGNFYFSTNAQSPYGKGQAGLSPNP